MKDSLGVFWIFGFDPADRRWFYFGALLASLAGLCLWLSWSWVLSLFLAGSAFLVWRKRFAARRQMSCSRVKTIRNMARCEALMLGYWRRPDGVIKYEKIMSFGRLLELSPETAREEIRSALLRLQDNAPVDTGESIDDLLRPVYTFVETKRSPLQWTPKPAA